MKISKDIVKEFETIKLSEIIKGTCQKCKKCNCRVTVVSEQTVNPFNTKSDGTAKTRQEVFKSVKNNLPVLTNRWKEKFICKNCYKNLKWEEKWFNESEYEVIKKESEGE